jgi:hypothetical protein
MLVYVYGHAKYCAWYADFMRIVQMYAQVLDVSGSSAALVQQGLLQQPSRGDCTSLLSGLPAAKVVCMHVYIIAMNILTHTHNIDCTSLLSGLPDTVSCDMHLSRLAFGCDHS